MAYQLSTRQNNWLQSASSAEIAAFIGKGPLEAVRCLDRTQINNPNALQHFIPFARGVRLGIGSCPTSDEALEEGRKKLAQLLNGPIAELDEVALGIDDTNRNFGHLCEKSLLRIDHIIHLGASAHDPENYPDSLRDLIDDADALEDLTADFPFLEKEILARQLDGNDAYEAFAEGLERGQYWGFLIWAITPVKRSTSGGFSFSWGHCRTHWFYAETFQGALDKASQWASPPAA